MEDWLTHVDTLFNQTTVDVSGKKNSIYFLRGGPPKGAPLSCIQGAEGNHGLALAHWLYPLVN